MPLPRAATRFGIVLVVLLAVVWGQTLAARAEEAGEDSLTIAARLEGDGSDLKPLPRLLGEADAVRYARIFTLQEKGLWSDVDSLISGLQNRVLMGYVLAQRFLHPDQYVSTYAELAAWLDRYADLPDAEHIYRLALKRKPAGVAAPAKPIEGSLHTPPVDLDAGGSDGSQATAKQPSKRLIKLMTAIKSHISDGNVRKAYDILRSPEFDRLAEDETFDRAAQSVAFAHFLKGKDKPALDLAHRAAIRSGELVPLAHWTAGLSAYRLGKLDTARKHFAALAQSAVASARQRAAGGYWAARASLLTGHPNEVFHNLEIAAGYPTTFYGLLARESLAEPLEITWERPMLNERGLQELLRYPEVTRALALIESGQRRMAEAEFEDLSAVHDPARSLAMLGFASQVGLPATEIRLAYGLADHWDSRFNASLYPVPIYRPVGGFTVDRALVFAFMRQESGFNPFAHSSAGAAGLMQLMPATAAFISGDGSLDDKESTALFDPELNLTLGQRYIEYLLANPVVEGNLFYLAAAYNAGPGNLKKWRSGAGKTDDPLMFIESMPPAETRHFVQQVMANYWIYTIRLGGNPASLRALAAGSWPTYKAPDRKLASAIADAGN
ncbi:MAG: lytic transglycosylase domain-containing protein [Alphaproteobacteria bacterium]|nr:lytic transglycosylase domain-containing protein [Alphaproteobacteria bacterium]